MPTYVSSFNTIRLNGQSVAASGGNLTVGTNTVVYQNQTGAFYPANNPNGFITSAQAGGVQNFNITGNLLSGSISVSGISGIVVQTGFANTILIGLNPVSGFVTSNQTGIFITSFQTGQFLYTGNTQEFSTIIATGFDFQAISFPAAFTIPPRVLTTVEITGNYLYMCNIQNRTTSGYMALFSDVIQESGVTLHTLASIQ